jgi:outer membrane receptor for ferrienterochelin and colicin
VVYTGFVQDDIRLHRDLTVDLGLRYDRQTLTDATTNLAPRLGFGWHPGGDPRLSIRGGYGIYYTQIRSNAVAGYLVNGAGRADDLHGGPRAARLPDLPDPRPSCPRVTSPSRRDGGISTGPSSQSSG